MDWPYIFAHYQSVLDFWDTLYSVLNRLIQLHVTYSLVCYNNEMRLPRHVRAVVLRKIKALRRWKNVVLLLIREIIIVCPSNKYAAFIRTGRERSMICY